MDEHLAFSKGYVSGYEMKYGPLPDEISSNSDLKKAFEAGEKLGYTALKEVLEEKKKARIL